MTESNRLCILLAPGPRPGVFPIDKRAILDIKYFIREGSDSNRRVQYETPVFEMESIVEPISKTGSMAKLRNPHECKRDGVHQS
ncbi:MAG: hypothetical protein ACTSUE_00640 [Promethearchaeota archaeon]